MCRLDLTTVATFSSAFEAHIVANQLEAAGIRAFVINDEIVGMAWHLGTAVGGVQIQVLGKDVGEAKEIVESLETVPRVDESDRPHDDPTSITPPNDTEAIVNRALRAAAIGVLLLPLQFYSMVLIGRLIWTRVSLNSSQKKKLILASLLNCCVLAFASLYISSLFAEPIDYYLPNGEKGVPIEVRL